MLDYLPDNEMLEARKSYLQSTGHPGEYLHSRAEMMKRAKPGGECRYGHPAHKCNCGLPVLHIGQDESIYKKDQKPVRVWKIDGQSALRSKHDGPSLMVNGYQDQTRGFGVRLSLQELAEVNEQRAWQTPLSLHCMRHQVSSTSSLAQTAMATGDTCSSPRSLKTCLIAWKLCIPIVR